MTLKKVLDNIACRGRSVALNFRGPALRLLMIRNSPFFSLNFSKFGDAVHILIGFHIWRCNKIKSSTISAKKANGAFQRIFASISWCWSWATRLQILLLERFSGYKKLGGFARSCGLPASWRSEHIGFLVRFLESETWWGFSHERSITLSNFYLQLGHRKRSSGTLKR